MLDAPPIPEDLAELIEQAEVGYIGTCDAENVPEVASVRGARVAKDRRDVIALVPITPAGKTFENLRANLRVTLAFARAVAYRAAQVKGRLLLVRPATEQERAYQQQNQRAFSAVVARDHGGSVRLPEAMFWPAMAVEVRVEEKLVQTPGPGAGRLWP